MTDEPIRHESQSARDLLDRFWTELIDTKDGEERSSVFYSPKSEIGAPAGVVPQDLLRNAGHQIGPYVLVSYVGSGGMGQVWRALDTKLNRDVAIKMIRPELRSEMTERMFERESRASAKVSHPAIVEVFAVGEDEDILWIAQEYVEGECTLDKSIGDLSADDLPRDYDKRAARFCLQLADALAATHDQLIVHRDIKPANIMVVEGDRPKLTDFGLARSLEEGSDIGLSILGGSPGYMSPEQADPTKVIDSTEPRADVFSLGATMYHVLTLTPPFGQGPPNEVLLRTLSGKKRSVEAVRPETHPDLAAICSKAMETHPDDRYQDMAELRDDLLSFLYGRSVAARPLGRVERGAVWVRRNPVPSSVITAALLAVVLLTWLVVELSEARQVSIDAQFDAIETRALAAIDTGNEQEALEHLRGASELIPDSYRPHLILAGMYAQRFQGQRAREELDAAIEKGYDPTQLQTASDYHMRGLSLMAEATDPHSGEAEDYLSKALELDPDRKGVWFPLYRVRSALGDHRGAIDAISRFKENLTLGDPQLALVAAYELRERRFLDDDLRHHVGALEILREGEGSLDEVHRVSFHHLMAVLLIELGRHEEALASLEVGLGLRPDHLDMRVNRAMARALLAESKQGEERSLLIQLARDESLEVLEAWPWSMAALTVVVRAEYLHFCDVGQSFAGPLAPLEYLPSVEALRAHWPETELEAQVTAAVDYRIGKGLLDSGSYESALPCLVRCTENRPNDLRAFASIGLIHWIHGRVDEGARAYDSAYQVWVGRPVTEELLALPSLSHLDSKEFWIKEALIGQVGLSGLAGSQGAFDRAVTDLELVLGQYPFESYPAAQSQASNALEALAFSTIRTEASDQLARSVLAGFLEHHGSDPQGWEPNVIAGIQYSLKEIDSWE